MKLCDRILDPKRSSRFLTDFLALEKKVAYFGAINSLAQTLLKITSPGVPDFYQGTELWDLSLADPDNRRPVDYQIRMGWLDWLKVIPTPNTFWMSGKTAEFKMFLVGKR